MPRLDTWTDDRGALYTEASRASSAWRRILDRPTIIEIRGKDPQTVRVEYDDTAVEEYPLQSGSQRTIGMQHVVVFGVRNHPTVEDTVIDRNDRFTITMQDKPVGYEVVSVIYAPGEIQALCEAKN